MVLTKEKLLELGFETNHPEKMCCKLYKKNTSPTWQVVAEPIALLSLNTIVFDIHCIQENEHGLILKESSVSNATTLEELETCMELCGIDFS